MVVAVWFLHLKNSIFEHLFFNYFRKYDFNIFPCRLFLLL
jgi:hypothetical protein